MYSAIKFTRCQKRTYCHNERVCETCRRIGKMFWELNVMVIQKSARNHSEPVKSSNARLSKKSGHDVTNNASNSVGSKDLRTM